MNIYRICELNSNSTLSKNMFTRIKYGMLYVKPKVQLSSVGDNNYSLKLRRDCVVSFVSQAIFEGVKKRGIKLSKLANSLTTKTWYLSI